MKKEESIKKRDKHYKFWYCFVTTTLRLFLYRNHDIYPSGGSLPEGGNLILANHVTKVDQFLVNSYYGLTYIRFVSGENVFRNPLYRRFAINCLNIIIHMRGVSAYDTIREMAVSLKRGENVMIFPTGTMTFDGKSQNIDTSIAKLIKMSSCNLIMLTTNGGYFIQPRWGVTTRKGQITLNEFALSKNELKTMTVDEITSAINEHLYTDAYAIQNKLRIKYKGKKLCKGLECCIYECPKCGQISDMTTTNTELVCKCGFKSTYDEYGYLQTVDGETYTITDLCDRQKSHLYEKFSTARNNGSHEYLFGDNFVLTNLHHSGRRDKLRNIRVNVYSDIIEYTIDGVKKELEYNEIDSIFVYMRNTLDVHLVQNKNSYELQGNFSCNALKYRDLFNIIRKPKFNT
ncbi:MAG: 1-acyl-sn-glycerol-3-phosphate acyltransferase [Lachnospiraceae bacterium]|nr:1-acyl-sn-glycerol-3-phosphate acyltransferase [Candidatus Colinaster equi]